MPAYSGALLLEGPGRVSVVSGVLHVLGYRLEAGGSIVVPAGRRVPALAEDAVLEHSLSGIGELSEEAYRRLDSLAERLAEHGRVMIVGRSDSGKSTLAAWVANKAGADMLTLDVGQNELFCPGFAARLRPEGPVIPGSSSGSVEACFVGGFSPRGLVDRYLYCAARLSRNGRLVVDTDGWVSRWDGLLSKAAAAVAVGVEVIVSFGLDPVEVGLLERYTGAEVVVVEPFASQSKSVEERRTHRDRLIAGCVSGGESRNYKVDKTIVVGAPIFRGTPVDVAEASKLVGAPVVYAELADGVLHVVSRRRVRAPRVRVLQPGWERGLIAAVHSEGRVWPGIVTGVSYKARVVTVHTRAPAQAELVEIGVSRVDPDKFTGKPVW